MQFLPHLASDREVHFTVRATPRARFRDFVMARTVLVSNGREAVMLAILRCLLFGHDRWSTIEGEWFCTRCRESGTLDGRPLALALARTPLGRELREAFAALVPSSSVHPSRVPSPAHSLRRPTFTRSVKPPIHSLG